MLENYNFIIYLAVEILLMLFSVAVLIINWQVAKENKNPLDKMLFPLVFLFILRGVREGLKEFQILGIPEYIFKYKGVTTAMVIDTVLAMFGLWFILYAYNLKEFYGVPIILGYFMEAYCFATQSEDLVTYIAVGIACATYVVHFINVFKNKNGMSFSIGMVGLIVFGEYFFNEIFGRTTFVSYMVRFSIMLVFLLGLNGFWDDKVFYDRAKRKSIQNAWITSYLD